ncbi:bifunctional 3'5'-cyclic nucleotide phosphodiesterase/3'5'-cyclic nucleotide phosphodiesterase [Babesia duncani]|uniref:Bifunctional 3'5'-cyclic nucleotide phosphodiesterase/3'5'-cyclic nucleotide phosphodiesterase n=1 Tax=Babesia duncani TaxID=323732 RepID=A0AAD9PHZ7_9APIC|nr:bifunctional 3'5'-cyclic nucleotide phosphodiesterase/3'5'-cyclic nucleotide phosphodiesterase [Babesia duncani]
MHAKDPQCESFTESIFASKFLLFKCKALENLYGLNVSEWVAQRSFLLTACTMVLVLVSWVLGTISIQMGAFKAHQRPIHCVFHPLMLITLILFMAPIISSRYKRHYAELVLLTTLGLVMAVWMGIATWLFIHLESPTSSLHAPVIVGGLLLIINVLVPTRFRYVWMLHLEFVLLSACAIVAKCTEIYTLWAGVTWHIIAHTATALLLLLGIYYNELHTRQEFARWFYALNSRSCQNLVTRGSPVHQVGILNEQQSSQMQTNPVCYKTSMQHKGSLESMPTINVIPCKDLGARGPLADNQLHATTTLESTLQSTARLNGNLYDWNFDILTTFKNRSNPLVAVGLELLKDFRSRYKIPQPKLAAALGALERLYNPNVPYHNAMHGAMVAQKVACLSRLVGLHEYQNVLERATIIIAALGHDAGHPGRTNAHLKTMRHPLAAIFGESSILEKFHASCTLSILRMEQYDILRYIPQHLVQGVRRDIVEYILATDMADHEPFLEHFQPIWTCKKFDMQANVGLVTKMVIKAADISAATVNWEQSQEWTWRLLAEFYTQGNVERNAGLPIIPLYDSNMQEDIAKLQAQFFKGIVLPLYTLAFQKSAPTICMQQLQDNIKRWEKLQDSKAKLEPKQFNMQESCTIQLEWILPQLVGELQSDHSHDATIRDPRL